MGSAGIDENPKETKSALESAIEDLFEFAIDRDDVKWLLTMVPETESLKPALVEYELQLLKIITVGWGISFYLNGLPQKEEMATAFWQKVSDFSQGLSQTTGLMIGQEIDYFQTLKERLDSYVGAMQDQHKATDPVSVAGPHFAGLCGDSNDTVANLVGAKMFDNTHKRVKAYLVGLKLI